jgi:Cu+-exporting ATPase
VSEPLVETGAVESAKTEDPVCGMEIDPGGAAATVRVNETTHHFCSTGCRDQFMAARP